MPHAKRKDDRKKNVIISERRVKKNAAFQIAEIPHPYSSREQYHAAMRGSLGAEWNVTGAVKEWTRPEVMSRAGKMIQPMSVGAKATKAVGGGGGEPKRIAATTAEAIKKAKARKRKPQRGPAKF